MGYLADPTISVNRDAGVVNITSDSGFSTQAPLQNWVDYIGRQNQTIETGQNYIRDLQANLALSDEDANKITFGWGSREPDLAGKRSFWNQQLSGAQSRLGGGDGGLVDPYNLYSTAQPNVRPAGYIQGFIDEFGGADLRNQYESQATSFIKSQNGGTFGKFLKGASNFFLPNMGAVGGATNAFIQGGDLSDALKAGAKSGLQAATYYALPAAAGAFAPAAATGVAAGGATAGVGAGAAAGGLGSFATNAALTGAITGGLGGLASGGNLSSALKGAALGGVTGGFGGGLGSSLGLGQVGQQALTSGLTGASGGLASGNLNDALIGGALGAGGGYLKAGGTVPGLGSMAQQLPSDVYGPARQGTGLLGSIGDLTQSTGTGLTIGGQPMKLGSLLGAAGDIYGYAQGKSDIDDIQQMLAQQSAQAQAQFQPYAQAGQGALDALQGGYDAFTQDPGYQFRLEQGNQALERSLAARGMGQSGAALKAAQEYGQGLADQSYNDFFTRQSSLAGQGLGAASGLGSLYTNLGNVQAAAQLQQINDRNKLLSSLGGRLGGIFG